MKYMHRCPNEDCSHEGHEYETTDQLRCHCCDTKMVIDNPPAPPMPYYYLTVAYHIQADELDESSNLSGPFETESDREAHILDQDWDEESFVENVTLLEVRDGKIVATDSGLATSSGRLLSHAQRQGVGGAGPPQGG